MCVNKDFVHSGSIGLILGKHARYVIMYVLAEFSSMTFFLNVFVAGSVASVQPWPRGGAKKEKRKE